MCIAMSSGERGGKETQGESVGERKGGESETGCQNQGTTPHKAVTLTAVVAERRC